ncbi:MAG TPA: hypothetical protein VEG34_17030 [Thermoanaerobaculia bacterium]|nr:hypothetical protein [Thermoanaerobaculia bacterium]
MQALLAFIALFHVLAGLGLMFSVPFQQFCAAAYGATLPWDARNIYFIRIVGSFAFVLGYLAAMAARDPLKHKIVIVGFIEFFVLRNINRHLYSQELYSGFGVSPLVNDLTTFFFGAQAVVLAVLLWRAGKNEVPFA